MKKLLLVLAIGAFVACNDSATTDAATSDTSSMTVEGDTTTMMAPMDTTNMMSQDTIR
ncbi:MAG: hypothetical protein WKF97_17065 [Chitinophagaceae bacterium]